MKRTIQYMCILLAVLCILSGCGKATAEQSHESVIHISEEPITSIQPEWNETEEPATENAAIECLEPLVWESEEDTNLAGLLQEQGTKAMVSLEAGDLRGSGMIYNVYEDTMVVLTAAHVLAQEPDAVIVKFADGTCLISRLYRVYEEDDLAVLAVKYEELPTSAVKTVLTDNSKFETSVAGNTCIAMGGSEHPGEEAFEGKILAMMTYLEDYGRNMTLAQGICNPGMSGGGLFDSRGYLLGLLSGFDEADRIAVVPLPVIQERVHSFLNNVS